MTHLVRFELAMKPTHLLSPVRSASLIAVLCLINSTAAKAEGETHGLVDKARNGSAADVARAVQALPESEIHREQVAGQLTLLLDDERIVGGQAIGSQSVRDYAFRKLLDLPPKSVSAVISRIPLLKTSRARGMALEVIGRVGEPSEQASDALISYFQDEDSYVRSRAVFAIDAIGDNSVSTVSRFKELLRDSDPMVQWTVLDALDSRRDQIGSLSSIIDLLESESIVYISVSTDSMRPARIRQPPSNVRSRQDSVGGSDAK